MSSQRLPIATPHNDCDDIYIYMRMGIKREGEVNKCAIGGNNNNWTRSTTNEFREQTASPLPGSGAAPPPRRK